MINPRWVSETRVGLGYHDFGVYPTDKFGPAIDIGAISFGRDFILPVRVVERVFQIRQNFMRVSGRQTLKFGADINPLRDSAQAETFFSGRFVFGEAIPLSNVIDSVAGPWNVAGGQRPAGRCRRGAARGRCRRAHFGLAGVRPRLAHRLPAGLRQSELGGLGQPDELLRRELDPGSCRTLLLTLGLRYELELKTNFPRDYNNFAPRAGFAWSPDPKTVARGGFGIYYSRIDGHIGYINDLLGETQQINQVFIPLTGIGGLQSPLTGQPLTSAEIYQTLQARGVLGQRAILRKTWRLTASCQARDTRYASVSGSWMTS